MSETVALGPLFSSGPELRIHFRDRNVDCRHENKIP